MTHDPLDELLRDAARSYRVPPEAPRDLMWQRIEAARNERRATAAAPWLHSRWLRNAAGVAAVLLAGILIGRATNAPDASSPATPTAAGPIASVPESVADSGLAAPSSNGVDIPLSPASRSVQQAGGTSSRVAVRAPRAGGDAGTSDDVPRQGRGVVGDGTEMSAYRLAVVEHLARTEVLLTGFRAQASGESSDPRTAGQQFAVLSRELLQNTRLLLATHATDDPVLARLLEDLELVLMQISQYAEEGRSGDVDAINQSLDRRNVLPKLRSTIPAGAPVPSGT